MEKILLNEEQERRFIEKFKNGDIFGLEELEKILRYEIKIDNSLTRYNIYDLLDYVISLNSIVVCGEQSDLIEDLFEETQELYLKYKNKLFNMFANDFKKYF